ncbi:hypothetical protein PENSUB_5637 [Penicillium subrubescens]|uniref:Uncharacterized protein n=1 Tax=Penicillium subrubescens TaxID=1316194 RepID=A0A1Q5U724_9EURO|nr:hypothetical protein PENSUB_5637 [Penicillium subrubescens]
MEKTCLFLGKVHLHPPRSASSGLYLQSGSGVDLSSLGACQQKSLQDKMERTRLDLGKSPPPSTPVCLQRPCVWNRDPASRPKVYQWCQQIVKQTVK